MKKKITVILLVLAFINIATFSLVLTTKASPAIEAYDTEALRIDYSPDRFDYGINLDSLNTGVVKTSSIGETKFWLSLDDYNGFYFFTEFELRAQSTNTEIWVQTLPDRLYPGDHPCNDPAYQDEDGFYNYPEITQKQIDHLLLEFDDNIYSTDTLYYGTPDFHNGTNSLLDAWGYVPPGYYEDPAGKNVILVSNVRDAAYYTDFRFYIAGFFSSSLEAYCDRNIISIDTHQWYRRIGPEGHVWHSEILDIDFPPVDRPYLYEGTIAHEYQHLLHSDYVPGDLLIMNEGFSTFAEFLCGYGVPVGDINYFLATPDNSLTEWGDQQGNDNILADYGQAFLWACYLSDHYGGSDFLSYYMKEGVPGFPGIQNALDYFGAGLTFDEVFHNWRIANLIHSDSPGCGLYNYDTIDLGSDEFRDILVYSLEDNEGYTPGDKWPKDLTGFDFGYTVCDDDYPLTETYLVSSYGSDYIRFDNPRGGFFSGFEFNGQNDIEVPGWIFDDFTWEGMDTWTPPNVNLADFLHVADIQGGGTLTFETIYNIEPYWDFGFVQVSTDGGETWISLENANTTYLHDSGAKADIVANLPGLTGDSGGWISMSFDLSAYSGDILLGFHYMTDWNTLGAGWWIANVDVDGIPVTNFYTPYPKCDFMVTLLRESTWRRKTYYTFMWDMNLDDASDGTAWLFPFTLGHSNMIAIISPRTGPADYSFSLHKHIMKWK
ncbi:MAG: hypothetical protein ACFFAA_05715 [Promethearchaeota archaeon]